MNNNHIEFKNVSVSYDGISSIIEDLSLTIKKGEFTTLLGPSGCGKSTILRMIGGFVQPNSGEILLSGKDISGVPPYERPVNMVFQSYALFPHLNVYGNVAFGLKMKKISREEIDARVKDALRIVDLEDFEKRNIRTLSGGQQQRVAIARAIVNRPEVLLLDEPLSALDYKMRKEMQIELKQIHKELGITFVFVTHDQEEALTMSDKVIVMSDGIIQQHGTPEEIYNEPSNIFVADFIGDCNIFDGVMSAKMEVTFGGEAFPCVDDYEIGSRVNVIIRPEDVDIVPKEEGKLKGIVTSVDFKGIFYETYIQFGTYEMEVHTLKHLPVGQEVGLDVAADMIHIINADVNMNRVEGVVESVDTETIRVKFEDFYMDIRKDTLIGSDNIREGSVISGYYNPGFGEMSDDISAGFVSGNIMSFVYMGDRYRYLVRSASRNDYFVDDPYLWNVDDMVSIVVPTEKWQFSVVNER